jgi:hypothetical protein
MTVTESKDLKKGNHAYWRGDPAGGGIVTGTSWDAGHHRMEKRPGGHCASWRHARYTASSEDAHFRSKPTVM